MSRPFLLAQISGPTSTTGRDAVKTTSACVVVAPLGRLRLLALRLAYPEVDIVPCRLVDEMWHRHILDTQAYAEDCERIFGDSSCLVEHEVKRCSPARSGDADTALRDRVLVHSRFGAG